MLWGVVSVLHFPDWQLLVGSKAVEFDLCCLIWRIRSTANINLS